MERELRSAEGEAREALLARRRELVLEEDERDEDGDDDDDDVDADLDLCCVWKKTRITPWLWPFHRSLQSTRNRMRTRAEAEN